MILLTGGTGFISGVMREQLTRLAMPYRLLLSATPTPVFFKDGEAVNLAVSSLEDERGLRAALTGVDYVYHLSGIERLGAKGGLHEKEIREIDTLVKVANDLGVKRFFYLSHIGADRASAYGLMKAKGIAENRIVSSGLNYTILRTGLVYGQQDEFTQSLARLIRLLPMFVFVPGDGKMLTQPLWVEDLVTSLIWALDLKSTERSILSVGGPEHLGFQELLEIIAKTINKRPKIVHLNTVQFGILTQFLQRFVKDYPVNTFWFDYLAENRVAALDSMSRYFGINPARFSQQIDYLKKDKINRR